MRWPGWLWRNSEKFVKLSINVAKEGYKEVHDCAGLNVCKGLGGCKVTAEKQAKLAKKRGVDVSVAGSPHDCAGLNQCKASAAAASPKKIRQAEEKAIAALSAN